jgi:hypothetical protein
MKNITLILLISLYSLTAFGQDISGQWNGALKVQGTQLRLVFNVTKTDSGFSSMMDSPDQGRICNDRTNFFTNSNDRNIKVDKTTNEVKTSANKGFASGGLKCKL